MAVIPSEGATCTTCGQWREQADFYLRNARTGNRFPHCTSCHAATVRRAAERRLGRLISPKPHDRDRAEKRCTSCGETLPIEQFALVNARTGQRRGRCAPCRRIETARWKADNAERKKATDAAYRAANEDILRERQRQWREAHPDRYRAIHSRWKAGNKDAVNAATWRRRYAIEANGGGVTVEEWRALTARYGGHCLFCGRREPEIRLCFDHVVPVSLGGPTTVENGQPLCRPCNSRKHRHTLDLRVGTPYDTRPDLPVGIVDGGN